MSQQSEERVPDSAPAGPGSTTGARILPFERPQSELQRAIQLRAQEAIDVDRDRDREVRRPRPLKWIIGLLVALIPVLLIFAAVDGLLRVLQKVTDTYSSTPATQAPAAQQPAEPPASQPGVVFLQPYESTPAAPDKASADSAGPDAKKPESKPDAAGAADEPPRPRSGR